MGQESQGLTFPFLSLPLSPFPLTPSLSDAFFGMNVSGVTMKDPSSHPYDRFFPKSLLYANIDHISSRME